jgi:hypothetical protein
MLCGGGGVLEEENLTLVGGGGGTVLRQVSGRNVLTDILVCAETTVAQILPLSFL